MQKISKTILLVSISSVDFGIGHFIRLNRIKKLLTNNFKTKHIVFKNITKSYKKKTVYRDLKKIYQILDRNLKNYNYIIFDITHPIIFKNNIIIKELTKLIENKNKFFFFYDDINQSLTSRINTKKKLNIIIPYFYEKNQLKQTTKDHYLLGTNYFPVDRLSKKIKVNNKDILITFGGSDLNNFTLLILDFLSQKFSNKKITVLIGNYFSQQTLRKIYKFNRKIKSLSIIQSKNRIIDIINNHKIIFTSSGLTKYEALSLKKKIVILFKTKQEYLINKSFGSKNSVLLLNKNNLNKIENKIRFFLNIKYNQFKEHKFGNFKTIYQMIVNGKK